MTALLLGFPECAGPAEQCARELGIPYDTVDLHTFPDGESLVRVPATADTVLLYRSLDHPNAKLIEIVLAAAALRDGGTQRVILIAPYLGYMRQDIAFRPGEAISQQVIGALLAERFVGLVTIDPHLHRIDRLDEAVPGIPAISLSAAPVLSSALDADEMPILIGPDSESRPWVEAIAAPAGLEVLIGEKQRLGDRKVSIDIAGVERVAGRKVILVDDVISSGETLMAAARHLKAAGAERVEALATHCLASEEDLAAMRAAGIAQIRAAQTVSGPAARLPIAALVAEAVRREFLAARA